MPAFNLSDADLAAIVAFIHDQKTKAESLGGGRRSVDAADLATGDAAAGRRYFNGAGGCSGVPFPTGDLAGIASRYRGTDAAAADALSRRPAGSGAPKVTVTLAFGPDRRGAVGRRG